jgi:hypothetical protein
VTGAVSVDRRRRHTAQIASKGTAQIASKGTAQNAPKVTAQIASKGTPQPVTAAALRAGARMAGWT